ncbi:uncharacterized protein BDW43DRAFT_203018 [Aspergillus alliaceus]|uniref:uncharacterized protein n=1 Tax=Petromyces alliaceus TaxID=209559 RepID=UPI0012A6A819|nr:uncharacterized protein BDW43DRAFT_203018 [Aspergillus alliaceus]KAB8237257.1 hypothetical protein BDW43DRAFT_203018 [Aspergillus alliaceus]
MLYVVRYHCHAFFGDLMHLSRSCAGTTADRVSRPGATISTILILVGSASKVWTIAIL